MISTGIMLRSIDISEQIINHVQEGPQHTTQSSAWMRTCLCALSWPVTGAEIYKLQACVTPPCDVVRSAECWVKWWTLYTQIPASFRAYTAEYVKVLCGHRLV
jgi:hypothetical protein